MSSMSAMRGCLLLFVSTFCLAALVESAGLNEAFTWTRIDYLHPTQSRFGSYQKNGPAGGRPTRPTTPGDRVVFPEEPPTPATTIADGEYIYENNIPMGANRWKNKLFITVPRRRLGVPSTLNYVLINSTEHHNVPLIPYPRYQPDQIHAPPTPDRIISAYRIAIDVCDRLWLVDTGIIEIPGNITHVQPQRIVVIDLNTDKIVKTYNFKDSDLTPNTILAYVTVDATRDKCDEAYAYFPDLAGFGLIVYSLKDDDSWRIRHNYFYLEPQAGEFRIGGVSFQWNDGIFSAALTDVQPDGFRNLIFHAMAGTHLYGVSTRVLRDKALATRSYHSDDFKILGDRGEGTQTSASDIHKPSGVLFMSLVNQNGVGCWNTNKPFKRENFGLVQKDDAKMIYPCDLKVCQNEVVVLTNSMPVFLYSTLNYDEVNFRIWVNSVENAVKGTPCA